MKNPAKPRPPVSAVAGMTMVMGRKEVLVQLDDDLIDRLDRLARKQGTSRSDLLRRTQNLLVIST